MFVRRLADEMCVSIHDINKRAEGQKNKSLRQNALDVLLSCNKKTSMGDRTCDLWITYMVIETAESCVVALSSDS